MPRQAAEKIQSKDITGLKYFDQLAPLLQRLHDDGCDRDKAGNRKLHYDQYCMLLLLYLFNPIVTSLRGIQQASELKKVQKKLGCCEGCVGLTLGSNVHLRRRTAQRNYWRAWGSTQTAPARQTAFRYQADHHAC